MGCLTRPISLPYWSTGYWRYPVTGAGPALFAGDCHSFQPGFPGELHEPQCGLPGADGQGLCAYPAMRAPRARAGFLGHRGQGLRRGAAGDDGPGHVPGAGVGYLPWGRRTSQCVLPVLLPLLKAAARPYRPERQVIPKRLKTPLSAVFQGRWWKWQRPDS